MIIGEQNAAFELQAAKLLFKEEFRSQDDVERGRATLVGSGTTFLDGLVLNGSGNLLYAVAGPHVLQAAVTIVIEFTPTFALDDGVDHYFCEFDDGANANRTLIYKSTANALAINAGATTSVVAVVYATLAPVWLSNQKNTLVLSLSSGATNVWLNGTLISSSATSFAWKNFLTRFSIGSRCAGTSRFSGTIHRFEIYGVAATSVDEPHLRLRTLISALDQPLITLPGISSYKRTADSKWVTAARGRAGITEVLMGTDGLTAAQFPLVAQQAELARGFKFDGGDTITVADAPQFTFSNGSADLPFSLSGIFSTDIAAYRYFFQKSTSATNGEYRFYCDTQGRLNVSIIDATAVAYLYRYSNAVVRTGEQFVGIATYSGSGVVTGIKIYKKGVRVDANSSFSGTYVRMRDTSLALLLGTSLIGNAILPAVWNFEISPMQALALTARLERYAGLS